MPGVIPSSRSDDLAAIDSECRDCGEPITLRLVIEDEIELFGCECHRNLLITWFESKLAALNGHVVADWYTDPHKLRTLVLHLIDQCGDRDEITRVVGEVLAKPWNWRTEYIVAKCREEVASI